MTTQFLEITPRDPIIARDGRPFTVGNRMKSLPWLYPSVAAGSLRSLIGKHHVDGFTAPVRKMLKQVEVAGPFPVVDQRLYVPAPRDLAVCADGRLFSARPTELEENEGTDLPHGLSPCMLDIPPNKDEFKPAPVPAFWAMDRLVDWLLNAPGKPFSIPSGVTSFLNAPVQDSRYHVQIVPETGLADDGMLFTTVGLDLTTLTDGRGLCNPFDPNAQVTLCARVHADNPDSFDLSKIDQLHPLGGERRLVHWKHREPAVDEASWGCPEGVKKELGAVTNDRGNALIRLVLASPALFENGWYPDWIDGGKRHPDGYTYKDEPTWQGEVQGHRQGKVVESGVQVRLVGACVERWQALSGWSLEDHGPKASRRLVPAGSVYFFEVLDGDVKTLIDESAGIWLSSICTKADDGQAARDGFGLALWGNWEPHPC